MVQLLDLHYVFIRVNGIIDDGESRPVDEVEDAMFDGEITRYLDDEFDDFQLSRLRGANIDPDEIDNLFAQHAATGPREHFLVENNGLNYVTAVIMEFLTMDRWIVQSSRGQTELSDAEFQI